MMRNNTEILISCCFYSICNEAKGIKARKTLIISNSTSATCYITHNCLFVCSASFCAAQTQPNNSPSIKSSQRRSTTCFKLYQTGAGGTAPCRITCVKPTACVRVIFESVSGPQIFQHVCRSS